MKNLTWLKNINENYILLYGKEGNINLTRESVWISKKSRNKRSDTGTESVANYGEIE